MAINPQYTISNDNGTYPQVDLLSSAGIVNDFTFCRENSTHTVTDLGNGLTIETFVIFAKGESVTIMATLELLENHLNLAHELYVNPSPHERVRLTDRKKDEDDARTATIIGGTITQIPDSVLTTDLKRDAARFAVTIERYSHWELGSVHNLEKKGLSVHGGELVMPNRFSYGVQDGRISIFNIATRGGMRIKKIWAGIKPAVDSLDDFDPEIRIRAGGMIRLGDDIAGLKENDTDFFDDTAVEVHWQRSDDTGWGEAFSIDLPSFNASAGPEAANRAAYYGKYHLLLRYRTTTDFGETYGIRAGYGWGSDGDATQLDSHYVPSTDNDLHYLDMGVITIGGDGFSTEIENRVTLKSFRLSIHATVIDNYQAGSVPVNLSWLYIGSMQLVPAEKFIYAELPVQIDATYKAEIYKEESGGVYGLIIWRDDTDGLGQPHPNAREVYYSIADIDGESWAMPTLEGSKLVLVTDNDTGTTGKTATANVGLRVVSRTVGV